MDYDTRYPKISKYDGNVNTESQVNEKMSMAVTKSLEWNDL